MRSPRASVLGIAAIIFTLLAWSSVFLFINHFASQMDVWTSNGWRYAMSSLFWAPVLLWQYARKTLPKGLWRASVLPAVLNAIAQVAFAWAFYKIDPTTTAFSLPGQIVFVALGAYILFPAERPLLRHAVAWVGMALVFAGLLGNLFAPPVGPGIHAIGEHAGNPQTRHALGIFLAVLSGLFNACYALAVRKNMSTYSAVTAFAAISQLTSVIIVALMLCLARDPHTGAHDFGLSALSIGGAQFFLLFLSALIGIALGHVFYYIAIARLGVAVSAAVIQLRCFVVGGAEAIILKSLPSLALWISGSVAVGGAILLLAAQWP